MKTYIEIAGRKIPTEVRERPCNTDWDGRRSYGLRLAMSHQEAAGLFARDVPWALVNTYEPGKTGEQRPEERRDMRDYCMAGDIVDHRDGTLTVWMGQMTDGEMLEELRKEMGQ